MRISRQQLFMEIARVVSKRSTCHRLNVGAVLTLNNNIVSIGYNGTGPGEEHCKGNACELSGGACTKTYHAEFNAVTRFWRERLTPLKAGDELVLYVTHSPCLDCAIRIADEGIKRVYYEVPYRKTDGLDHLILNGVDVYQYTPSGYLLDHRTGLIETP